MHFLSGFPDTVKFADFWWKNVDINRIQGMCQIIYIGSFLGKV